MNLAFQELIFFILGGAVIKDEEEVWWRRWVRREGTKNANITPYRMPRNLNDAQKHHHAPPHFPLLPISSIFCLLPLRLYSLTPLLKVILLGRRSISLILSFVDYFIYLFFLTKEDTVLYFAFYISYFSLFDIIEVELSTLEFRLVLNSNSAMPSEWEAKRIVFQNQDNPFHFSI